MQWNFISFMSERLQHFQFFQISKMEHMSQQQYVTVEGIDNSNARALVVKLINVVLTVLQVVLLLVATAAGIIMPFLKTRFVLHHKRFVPTYNEPCKFFPFFPIQSTCFNDYVFHTCGNICDKTVAGCSRYWITYDAAFKRIFDGEIIRENLTQKNVLKKFNE